MKNRINPAKNITSRLKFSSVMKNISFCQGINGWKKLRLRSSLMLKSWLVKIPVQEALNGEIETVFSFHGRKENQDSWRILCRCLTWVMFSPTYMMKSSPSMFTLIYQGVEKGNQVQLWSTEFFSLIITVADFQIVKGVLGSPDQHKMVSSFSALLVSRLSRILYIRPGCIWLMTSPDVTCSSIIGKEWTPLFIHCRNEQDKNEKQTGLPRKFPKI